jgi:5-aminopentanamidase
MRVTALELPARWGRPERALAAVETALERDPATDLVLLPEAALTGYVSPAGVFDPTPFAESRGGASAQAMARLARRFGLWLGGPLIEQDGARFYNALLLFDPQGALALHYRKRHPWFPEAWATPGDAPADVVRVAGGNVTAAICFDVHFLAQEAAASLAAADVLLFPSAWVEEDEEDTRAALLRDLAQQFDLAIVNANWGPGLPAVRGQGGSRIVARSGETLARAAPGRPRIDAAV